MLAGGAGRRLGGTDKALLPVDGRSLIEHIGSTARTAGAAAVLAVGGDRRALEHRGFTWVADEWPGAGPLGGLVTGLAAAPTPVAVVLACDLPAVRPDRLRALVDALATEPGIDAVVPVVRGRAQPLLAAYRSSSVAPLRAVVEAGERAVHRGLDALAVRWWVVVDDGADFDDVDTPADLARLRRPPEAPLG